MRSDRGYGVLRLRLQLLWFDSNCAAMGRVQRRASWTVFRCSSEWTFVRCRTDNRGMHQIIQWTTSRCYKVCRHALYTRWTLLRIFMTYSTYASKYKKNCRLSCEVDLTLLRLKGPSVVRSQTQDTSGLEAPVLYHQATTAKQPPTLTISNTPL